MMIRPMRFSDLQEVVALELDVWGDEAATEHQIRSRLATCPEGSVVAELPDGLICGYAAAQRVKTISAGSWAEQTDNGFITDTHREDGSIAFGINLSVPPFAARHGVSGAVIEHYAKVFVAEGGCSLMCLGTRLPGFRRWRNKSAGSIDDYLREKRNGRSIDPELALYERAGFRLMWEIEKYFPDQRSEDYGALIAMTRWEAEERLLRAA